MSRTKKRDYTGSKKFDKTCRCHGGCEWCEGNRKYQHKKEPTLKEQVELEELNIRV